MLLSIANHADKFGRGAFPKVAYIAQEARLSERQVLRALKRLEEEGWIAPDEWPADRRAPAMNRRPRCWKLAMPGVTSSQVREEPGVTSATGRGDIHDTTGVTSATAYKEEPSLVSVPEPSTLMRSKRARFSEADFEAFWAEYPTKKSKAAARRAFGKALATAGSLDVLVQGARRYANDPNRDPKKSKYAQGWLNDERWNDEDAEDSGSAALRLLRERGTA